MFAHNVIQWLAADPAGTVYTVSGLSFRPNIIRFTWVGIGSAVDADTAIVNQRRGGGFATSVTDRRCVGTSSVDAAATASCDSIYRTDAVVATVNTVPAADGLLDINSILEDGFTLIVDLAAPVNISVAWEAFGEADITAETFQVLEPAAVGNVNVVLAGAFRPTVVMFFGNYIIAAPPAVRAASSGFFAGWTTGSAAEQNMVAMGQSDDGAPTMDTDGYIQDAECLAGIALAGGASMGMRATLVSFNVDGFTLNYLERIETNRTTIGVAIKGGQWAAGNYTIDGTTVGATATISGLPFRPIGALHLAVNAAKPANDATLGADNIFLGRWSSTTSRSALSCRDRDGVADSEIRLAIEYDQILRSLISAGLGAAFDLNAINPNGFQVITDVADPGAPTLDFHGYLAFASGVTRVPYQPEYQRGPILAS